MTVFSIKKAAAVSVALAGAVSPTIPMAQANDAGRVMTFGLGLRTQWMDNRNLDSVSPGSSFETAADLSFGLLTGTQTSRLSLDARGTIRKINTPGDVAENGFVNPRLGLTYDRSSAASRLSLDALLRETDLDDDLTLEDSDIVTNGDVTLRSARLGGEIEWGENTLFGYGVLASYEDADYSGGIATGPDGDILRDYERTTVGVTTRLDFNQVTRLNSALTYSKFDEAGISDPRGTISLENVLTVDRPSGPATLELYLFDTEDGTRVVTAVGRTLETQLGVLSGKIGPTRATTGDIFLTGSVDYNHSLPRGALNFGLSNDVSSDNRQDKERQTVRLSFGYLQELSELASLRFDADWVGREDTDLSGLSDNTSIRATYSHRLTQDWNFDVGYRYRYRDDSTTENAHSNTVFLELRRAFTTRF